MLLDFMAEIEEKPELLHNHPIISCDCLSVYFVSVHQLNVQDTGQEQKDDLLVGLKEKSRDD